MSCKLKYFVFRILLIEMSPREDILGFQWWSNSY